MNNHTKHGIDTNTARLLSGRDYARELVRTRDGYECQGCHKKWISDKRRFDVHHLNGLCGKLSVKADSVERLEGLTTLCHKCHFNHPQHSKHLDGTYGRVEAAEIVALRKLGLTTTAIGQKFGISRQRIYKILDK